MRVVKILSTVAVIGGMLTAVPAVLAAPPANDDFERAATVGDAPQHFGGTLDEATTQPGEPAHGSQTVWYLFRPTVTARVAFEVPDAPGMEVALSVYTGSTLAALQLVGRHEGWPARVAFDASAGQTYHIAIGKVGDYTGGTTFVLRNRLAPLPPNDAFAKATRIRIPGYYPGNLADTTAEPGEDAHHTHSLWYRFRPHRTGKLTIDFAVVGYDCKMQLYTGRSLRRLKLVKRGAGDVADALPPPMRLTVRRGVRYHLVLDCNTLEWGDFALTLSDGSIKGKGIALAVGARQTLASVRKRGLRMRVTARRRAGVGVDLRVSRRTARTLGLRSRVLGRTSGVVDRGKPLRASVRLSREARRALTRAPHLEGIVRLEILRSEAPNRVLTLPIKL
jgi:hypothetical protein